MVLFIGLSIIVNNGILVACCDVYQRPIIGRGAGRNMHRSASLSIYSLFLLSCCHGSKQMQFNLADEFN